MSHPTPPPPSLPTPPYPPPANTTHTFSANIVADSEVYAGVEISFKSKQRICVTWLVHLCDISHGLALKSVYLCCYMTDMSVSRTCQSYDWHMSQTDVDRFAKKSQLHSSHLEYFMRSKESVVCEYMCVTCAWHDWHVRDMRVTWLIHVDIEEWLHMCDIGFICGLSASHVLWNVWMSARNVCHECLSRMSV